MLDSTASATSHDPFSILARLVLSKRNQDAVESPEGRALLTLNSTAFQDLITLAQQNHVTIRALCAFQNIMCHGNHDLHADRTENALASERARIWNAIEYLRAICECFEKEGLDVTVIKSLDHWPDFGNDIDLYTNASSDDICRLMRSRFQAEIAPRSWGDRLACKWNFLIPGLPEAVEIHVGRLGQTGEQQKIASQLPHRSRYIDIGEQLFRVPSVSDRLIISSLQRMYRHFYFRLCDIVDSADLITRRVIDYLDLSYFAAEAGIWDGVATYLSIVSDYVLRYSGSELELPGFVRAAAHFGGEQVYVRGAFLRVPILPQSAGLYGSQILGLLRARDLENSARLGLLPWLATAAVIGQKLTGTDKGVW